MAGGNDSEYKVVYKAPKRLFDSNAQKVIEQARLGGPSYGTKGPTQLNSAARHHHVTNNDGVVFYFKGTTLFVVGYGKKHNRNTGRGDSGYGWDTK